MNPSPSIESVAADQATMPTGEGAAPRLTSIAGETSTSRLTLVHALFSDGQLDRAWSELSLALKENPELASAQHVKGVMLAGSDRLEEAVSPLELAIDLDPDADASYLVLGRTLQKLGHLNRALEVTNRLLRKHPEHAQGHALRGEILNLLGRAKAAISSLRESCRCDPSQAQIRLKLAKALQDEKLWDDALREFDICQQLAPNDPEVLIAKADAVRVCGKSAGAIELYREVLTHTPTSALAYARMGQCYFECGDFTSATSLLRTALLLDTKLVDAYQTLAQVYQAMGLESESGRMRAIAEQNAENRG
jgi:tetratricopeptide (TPR) repeat protein